MKSAGSAPELAHRLARDAEAVCQHYLTNGCRSGNYWLVGDPYNTPGRSTYVRLTGGATGAGAAGKWTDAATGEHGDLLDIIARVGKYDSFRDVLQEARRFLNLPRPEPTDGGPSVSVPRGSREAARRLHAMTVPIAGTLAERYLRHRDITAFGGTTALRFHPRCYYRDTGNGLTTEYPALIAAVTNAAGELTGVHRTWLDPDGDGKAKVVSPRRAMGLLLGSGVRFGWPTSASFSVMAAGEGLETVLSLRMVLPDVPMIAGLSSGHLGALDLPEGLQRLYIAGDTDAAGRSGTGRLSLRAQSLGIEVLGLAPRLGDFNDDLRRLRLMGLREEVASQLVPPDLKALVPFGR